MHKTSQSEMSVMCSLNIDKLKAKKPGTIISITYRVRDPRNGLSNFYKVARYQAQYISPEARATTKVYRAQGNPINNPAITNDEPTEIPCVFWHKRSGYKLRVPLIHKPGQELSKSTYFIGNAEVTKEDYYNQMKAKGYKVPERKPSKYGTEVRNFLLDAVLDIQ